MDKNPTSDNPNNTPAPEAPVAPIEPAATPDMNEPMPETSQSAPEALVEPPKVTESISAPTPTPMVGAPSEPQLVASENPAVPPVPADPSVTAPTLNPASEAPQMAPQPSKKKHHVGLIVAIVVILLFLIGCGGLAVWYFAIFSSPENVAFDAMRQLISAENVVATGNITVVTEDDYDDLKTTIQLEVKESGTHLPSMVDVTLSAKQTDNQNQVVDNHDIQIGLGSAVMADGVIYLKVSNLLDAIEAFAEENDGFYGEMADLVRDIVKEVDGTWWKIDARAIVKKVGAESTEVDAALDLYDCLLGVSKSEHGSEFSEIYSSHRFVTIERSDSKVNGYDNASSYDVTLDYGEMADFINALPETQMAEQSYVCINTFIDKVTGDSYYKPDHVSSSDIERISTSDLRDAFPDRLEIQMIIGNFDHQLKWMGGAIHDEDMEEYSDISLFTYEVKFEYTPNTVTAPSEYRDATELVEMIQEAITEYLGSLYDPFVPTECLNGDEDNCYHDYMNGGDDETPAEEI